MEIIFSLVETAKQEEQEMETEKNWGEIRTREAASAWTKNNQVNLKKCTSMFK